MKALLIAEYERFIKRKKYLTPILYLVICIIGALKARTDIVYIQTFPSFLYCSFFAQDFVDGNLSKCRYYAFTTCEATITCKYSVFRNRDL